MRFRIEIHADQEPPRPKEREIEVNNLDELADYLADEMADDAGEPLKPGVETRVQRLAYRGARGPHRRRPWIPSG